MSGFMTVHQHAIEHLTSVLGELVNLVFVGAFVFAMLLAAVIGTAFVIRVAVREWRS